MGIEQKVRNHTGFGERHILLGHNQAHHALLAVPGGELVAQLRNPLVPALDLGQAIAIGGLGEYDHVHHPLLVGSHGNRCLPPLLRGEPEFRGLLQKAGRAGLSYEHIIGGDIGIGVDQAVRVQLIIGLAASGSPHLHIGNLELVLLAAGILSLLRLGYTEEVASPQAALDGAPVHDQGILNVIALVGQDGHHEVLAGRPLFEAYGPGGLGPHYSPLGAVQVMASGVRPQTHIGRGHAQALLDHSRSHGVPGAGVVLRVGNQAGCYAQNKRRVQLQMGVVGRQVLFPDGDEAVFFLLGIQVLHQAGGYQIGEGHLAILYLIHMLLGDHRQAVLHNNQRPSGPTGVGVHEDLIGVLEVGHIHLAADAAGAAQPAQISNQRFGILMMPYYLSIDINPRSGT